MLTLRLAVCLQGNRSHLETKLILHPLLKLAMIQPHLLGNHMQAYAALVGEETKKASISLALRMGLYVGAAMFAILGLMLTGVALLLRASISSVDYPAGWALIVVPLTPFVLAAVLVVIARSKPIEKAFEIVKAQVRADMDLLKEVSST